MLVLTRFRIPVGDVDQLRGALQEAHDVLSRQRGYVGGSVGRNVDDPELWVLETRWEGPGAYRRALSAYEVKVHAWSVLGQALDEPTAYELVTGAATLNEARPRENG